MWCARLPITQPGSIVVLLLGFGGDHSPPLWHMALHREGCQCQRRGVVLHSPRVLRESLPVLSMDSSGNAAPLWWRSGSWHPCQALRGQGQLSRGVRHVLECGPVALWWYYWGKRGGLRVAFFLCAAYAARGSSSSGGNTSSSAHSAPRSFNAVVIARHSLSPGIRSPDS